MHALSKAGVPIIKALTGLQDASRSPAMAKVLGEVVKRLEGGVALASAMRPPSAGI
jgi:MSHA biogenesis protein MshG